MNKKQVHVLYSGSVQGVGFRFTAEAIARRLNLVGWVKNLRDGRVEIVAEEEEATLREFLKEIDQELSDYIKNTDVSWGPPTGEFDDFGIRF